MATLRAAIGRVAAAHQMLHSHLRTVDGEPALVPVPDPGDVLREEDLSGRTPRAVPDRIDELTRALRTPGSRPWTATLLRVGPQQAELVVVAHPLCFDPHSARVFWADLESRYRALAARRPDGPAQGRPDCSEVAGLWADQLDGSLDRLRTYWAARLRDLPAAATWPEDHPRAAAAPDGTAAVPFALSGAEAASLRHRAAEFGRTPAAVLTVALQVLLARVGPEAGSTSDVTVAVIRVRPAHPDADQVIGPLENPVPARRQVSPEDTARTLVHSGTQQDQQDRSNAAMPFPWIAALGSSGQSPCRVLLDVDDVPLPTVHLGSAVGRPCVRTRDITGFDLGLSIRSDGAGYAGTVVHRPQLHDRLTVRRFADAFRQLLRGLLEHPDVPIGDLPIAPDPPSEPRRAPGAQTHQLVAAVTDQHPEALALRWSGGSLSYAGLERAADRLAGGLLGARRVALLAERGPGLLVALLAVLRSGASYVPLDLGHPRTRRDLLLADSGADVVLTDADPIHDVLSVPRHCRVVPLSPVRADTADSPGPRTDAAVRPADPAYVIYTSGSTGQPKGVVMPHGPLAHLLKWQLHRSGSTVGWNTAQFTTVGFDVAFQEVFSTWASGGTLVVVEDPVRRDPERLLAYLRDADIHRLFLPFVALQQLAEAARRRATYPRTLREVITAGEQLQVTPVVREFFLRTGAVLENQYGPSETHVVTAERLEGPPGSWPTLPPIGRPTDAAVVEVLDLRQMPLPIGVPGEICVSGPVLADGYLGQTAQTEQRFVRRRGSGRRTYLTGDLGRVRPDGRIDFLGRRDGEVKIRGHRVDVGEVEVQLRGFDGVTDAGVVAVGSEAAGRHLVAGYRTDREADLPVAALRDHLGAVLPGHMVPTRYVRLTDFPLTVSGKLDRAALTARLAGETATPAAPDAPGDSTEHRLARIWSELLGVPVPGPDAGFFELGGHSLLVGRLATRIEEVFGPMVALADLFTEDTVARQARLVEQLYAAEMDDYLDDDADGTLDLLSELLD